MKSKLADEEIAAVSKENGPLLADEAVFILNIGIERRLLVLTTCENYLLNPE